MRPLPGLISVLALSACAAAIVPPAPQQAVSARFAAGAPQAASAIDLNWWGQFDDAQLTDLLRLADANSPSLRSAAAAVMKARAVAGQGDAGLAPVLTADLARSVTKQADTARATDDTAKFDASWEIDLFGKARQTAEAAHLSAAAEEAAFRGAHVSLSAEVASGFVQYRACMRIEAIYRAALGSQRDTLRATGDLVQAGLAPQSDAALAEASVASAAIALESQTADCRVLAQTLAVSVGVSQGQIDAILSRGGGLPVPRAFRVSSVPAEVLRQRPDIIEAELTFAAALASMGAAQADLFPSLSLGGSITLTDPKSWQFGPALSLPIFDGGAARASLRSAQAEAQIAGESWRKAVLSAVAETEGAMTRLSAARRNGASARKAVAGYQAYFDALDAKWRAGGETLLNRETARRSLQTAQITEVEQREAEILQWIALFKAAGGGWTRPALAQAAALTQSEGKE